MHDKIRELAEQAGAEPTPFSNVLALVGNDIEKFAELIVKECANIDFRRKVGLTDYLGYEIGKVIKSHFGVDE